MRWDAWPEVAPFLRARIGEDVAAAKDPGIWFGPYPETIGEFEGWLVIQEERVLAEAQAKLEILREWLNFLPLAGADYKWPEHPAIASARHAVAVVTAVYDAHPDYRPEWKP